ncbi:YceI family protein [Streptomyces sp. B6B3]|uniref:YceI family protein n=1 Tax=Streptomyces sp. B6B3 TaxID=3153570 RepID=UPI00325D0DD0
MSQPAEIPGYAVGRWTVDPVHSDASFTVRHLVSKVRGRFRAIEGTITTAENPLDSAITVSIDPSSIDTGNEQRDAHLRSADFLEVEKYPRLTFTSTGIRQNGDGYLVEGDLTIKDVTRSITAELELGGFTPGPDGVPLAGFTASFEIDRKDYNVNFSAILETGGVVVGDTIAIQLEVEAGLDQG